jgi:hypothetical protein
MTAEASSLSWADGRPYSPASPRGEGPALAPRGEGPALAPRGEDDRLGKGRSCLRSNASGAWRIGWAFTDRTSSP